MSALDELTELKRKLEICRSKADKAAGVYDRLLRTLKDRWGCETLQEAEDKLIELRAKLDKLQHEFNSQLKKWKSKWGDKLNELGSVEE